MIDDHRDYGDETTVVVEDIEHLDFDVPCDRCKGAGCGQPGSHVVTWVGSCPHSGRRWMFSKTCCSRSPEGPCKSHGGWGRYEVIG